MPRKVKQATRQAQSMPAKKKAKVKRQPKGVLVRDVKPRGY